MCNSHPSPLWGLKPGVALSFSPPWQQWAGRGPGAEEGRDGKACPRSLGRSFRFSVAVV